MRNREELLKLVVDTAAADDRIRTVTLEGSLACEQAVHDQFSDLDVTFFVDDIRPFARDRAWISTFGEVLIAQFPDDWHTHPYDEARRGRFACLMQFTDGSRIDLTLMDVLHIAEQKSFREPRRVLVNKDGFTELTDVCDESVYHVARPSAKAYDDVCNEFRWVSTYVSKGLCRQEFCCARHAFEVLMTPMLITMLSWRIGAEHGFDISAGKYGRHLSRFLPPEDMARLQGAFPDGSYENMWAKLFLMYDFFAETAMFVGRALGYRFNADESDAARAFLLQRREQKTAE